MASIETLADLRGGGYQLWAQCTRPDCGHGRALDLDGLIRHCGADYVIIGEKRIARACRCTCGAKAAKLTISPPTPQS